MSKYLRQQTAEFVPFTSAAPPVERLNMQQQQNHREAIFSQTCCTVQACAHTCKNIAVLSEMKHWGWLGCYCPAQIPMPDVTRRRLTSWPAQSSIPLVVGEEHSCSHFFCISVRANIVVELSKHSKRRSDEEATASEEKQAVCNGRKCKCHLLSARVGSCKYAVRYPSER